MRRGPLDNSGGRSSQGPGGVRAGALCTRAFSLTLFAPHSTVRPWNVPNEYFECNRAALQNRAELIPYIYTAYRQAFDSGLSIIRPMYAAGRLSFALTDSAARVERGRTHLFAPNLQVLRLPRAGHGLQGQRTGRLCAVHVWRRHYGGPCSFCRRVRHEDGQGGGPSARDGWRSDWDKRTTTAKSCPKVP